MSAQANYVYYSTISNVGIIENKNIPGFEKLDVNDMVIYDYILKFSPNCERDSEDSSYFFLSADYIITQLPLLRIKTKRGIEKRLEKLIKANIIVRHPLNQKRSKAFYRWGVNQKFVDGKIPQTAQHEREVEQIVLNSQPPTNESSDPLRTKVQTPTNESSDPYEQKFRPPTNESSDDNNTIDKNINNNSLSSQKKGRERERVYIIQKNQYSDITIDVNSVKHNFTTEEKKQRLNNIIGYFTTISDFMEFAQRRLSIKREEIARLLKKFLDTIATDNSCYDDIDTIRKRCTAYMIARKEKAA